MIILQIELAYFSVFEGEGDPPVPGHRDAPCSGPVAGKLVDVPSGRPLYTVHIRRGNQEGQDAAHPVDKVAPDFTVVVVLDEAL
jgi:hypothetical protein